MWPPNECDLLNTLWQNGHPKLVSELLTLIDGRNYCLDLVAIFLIVFLTFATLLLICALTLVVLKSSTMGVRRVSIHVDSFLDGV